MPMLPTPSPPRGVVATVDRQGQLRMNESTSDHVTKRCIARHGLLSFLAHARDSFLLVVTHVVVF